MKVQKFSRELFLQNSPECKDDRWPNECDGHIVLQGVITNTPAYQAVQSWVVEVEMQPSDPELIAAYEWYDQYMSIGAEELQRKVMQPEVVQ